MRYVWDPEKNEANTKKHGVTFDEAVEVFLDEYRIEEIDDRFDYGEERLIVIGMAEGNVLVVVAVEKSEDVIRIISARDAERAERRKYEEARSNAQR